MFRKYSDYITNLNEAYTGANPNATAIYWNNQINSILDKDWTQISVDKFSVGNGGRYLIKFRTGDEKNDYYSVLFVPEGDKDFYYLENSKLFERKLNTEFYKNSNEYYKNFKVIPKCLDITMDQLKNADKYNI